MGDGKGDALHASNDILPSGDFQEPWEGYSAWHDAFLCAIASSAPHLIRELRDEVYPTWKAFVDDALREGDALPGHSATVSALSDYAAWATRHNLGWGWMADAVERAFFLWRGAGIDPADSIKPDEWPIRPEVWVDSLFADDFRQTLIERIENGCFGTWHPYLETRASAEKRLLDEFKACIRFLLDATESTASKIGMVRLPKKHELRRHSEWTVRHHVLGESLRGIANSDEVDRKTVAEGVRSMLSILSMGTGDWMAAPGG